ncbi:methionine ABC transporter ATP-binding protein MetN 2 (plasmid) [Rhizobium gallicum bv. gallicum R602sp]|uniref:Cell division ATP-binding protein FtsE n=1 Tax=Rhizobium gallicum bv. gallicum R602sp TaxID=1041138 RepID=A0A0B4XCG7_9HYPH|nr:methionine ABC transporter ATP-binding protein MetN 2 [Rhizobium gallicum bv. gallicum R602sp]TDW25572.1 D-methionine transport system ATP-binding protein [Rhizobium azibense]
MGSLNNAARRHAEERDTSLPDFSAGGGASSLDRSMATARRGTIAFEGVEKTYASAGAAVHALKNITIDVPGGSIFGIIGRSGAGKSTLLRTVNRLERTTSGKVIVDGTDVGVLDEEGLVILRRRIGMIFQHFNLLSAKTVWRNVALPMIVAGFPRVEIDKRVAEALSLVGLEGKEDTYPSRLSGGQKQRVGIARALVHHPEILLCDEATSALDPETTLSILRLLKDINRRLNLTIVLITHEMSVIREICDHVLVLDRGQVAEAGPVWQVFANPSHDATRALLKPLDRDIPEDIAVRLRPAGDRASKGTLIELAYTGEGGLEPDIAAIAAAAGAPVRLLQSSVDRIQGHVHGRLLVIVNSTDSALIETMNHLANRVRVLGHVGNDV